MEQTLQNIPKVTVGTLCFSEVGLHRAIESFMYYYTPQCFYA